jgi:hypothetical protein
MIKSFNEFNKINENIFSSNIEYSIYHIKENNGKLNQISHDLFFKCTDRHNRLTLHATDEEFNDAIQLFINTFSEAKSILIDILNEDLGTRQDAPLFGTTKQIKRSISHTIEYIDNFFINYKKINSSSIYVLYNRLFDFSLKLEKRIDDIAEEQYKLFVQER